MFNKSSKYYFKTNLYKACCTADYILQKRKTGNRKIKWHLKSDIGLNNEIENINQL